MCSLTPLHIHVLCLKHVSIIYFYVHCFFAQCMLVAIVIVSTFRDLYCTIIVIDFWVPTHVYANMARFEDVFKLHKHRSIILFVQLTDLFNAVDYFIYNALLSDNAVLKDSRSQCWWCRTGGTDSQNKWRKKSKCWSRKTCTG